ncbi:class I SAM-dependent methyltransferase [bacterium]|nr:MAG: class I SAM-dependent methyltransferase [bacterium]
MSAKLTWEAAVQHYQNNASKQNVEQCYFHENSVDAAQAFYDSIEFKETLNQVKSKVQGKLLDIGAGNGIASYAFSKSEFTVYALEPDKSDIVGSGAIEKLNSLLVSPILISNEFGEQLPYPSDFFDVVYCRQVLHHARDLKQFMSEVARVLKIDGIVMTVRDHVISNKDDLSIFLNNHSLHKYYGGEHAFLLDDYIEAFKLAGLIIEKTYEPLSSHINYFPETDESVKMKIRGVLKSKMNSFTYYLSRLFSSKLVIKVWGARASKFYHAPGRLYSFILRKKV